MARPPANKTIEAHIGGIIDSAAAAIATAVRQEVAGELQRLLASRAGSSQHIAVTVPSVQVAIPRAGKPAKPRGGAGQKRNIPKKCIFPGCANPSKGPRWSFLCDKHKEAPKGERKKLLAQWKSQQGQRPASAPPAPKKVTAGKKPTGAKRGRKKKSSS